MPCIEVDVDNRGMLEISLIENLQRKDLNPFEEAAALQRLGEHADIELILLDINMPNMNGLEFLDKIKQDSALADIPVIIVSTEGKEEDTIRGLQAGAAAYIKKPFRSEEILVIIDRLRQGSAS